MDEGKRLYLNTCTPFPAGLYLMIVDRVFSISYFLVPNCIHIHCKIQFGLTVLTMLNHAAVRFERSGRRRRYACAAAVGLPASCRRIHVQRSARHHHSRRESRSQFLSLFRLLREGGKEVGGRKEGRRSNKSDSVHPSVRGRNSGKYRF